MARSSPGITKKKFVDICPAKAIKFFKLNVTNYPDSPHVYSSLAGAYTIKGDKQLTITHYEKSLALNPDNETVKDELHKLRDD